MKRRQFLQSSSLAGLPLMVKGINVSALVNNSLFEYINPDSDRVLVLIQCNGGYDGLNMLLPLDQYSNLSKVRSNLIIPEDKAIKIGDQVGLHPAMELMSEMYKEGLMNFIQAVGYPNQNRSHFRSTDIWVSGSASNEFLSTGWLGRHLDDQFPGYPDEYPNELNPDPFAITIGGVVSATCQGIASNFSIAINDPFSLTPLTISAGGEAPATYYGNELDFLRDAIIKTNEYSGVIGVATEKGTNTVEYPNNNRLSEQLSYVARMISGGLGTKIYIVSLGGFDTHANQVNQGDPTTGAHSNLLNTLSQSIQLFQQDLINQGLDERVVGMVFTEFGRRIKSNNSFGTDHGSAAPLFMFGSCVNPMVIGTNPMIPKSVGNQAGVNMQFDFRNIYGSILEDWFEVKPDKVKELLFSEYEKLPVLAQCAATSPVDELITEDDLDLKVYPSPFHSHLNIQWASHGENFHIVLIDGLGRQVKNIYKGYLKAGNHELGITTSDLPAGNYYLRFSTEKGTYSKLLSRQ